MVSLAMLVIVAIVVVAVTLIVLGTVRRSRRKNGDDPWPPSV
ncbi:hypothetical protein [Arthrobacter sp. U41]|nr:hypothetical protein [Arthrobacter sp. U41]